MNNHTETRYDERCGCEAIVKWSYFNETMQFDAKILNFSRSRNMTIANWDPFRNISALQDRINRMFWEAFPDSRLRDTISSLDAWCPSVDIHETNEAFVVQAELPGVKKEDVSIEVNRY